MKLSSLQRYIFREAFASRGALGRQRIVGFYAAAKDRPKSGDCARIISRSLDRLITRELAVGFGRKTAQKWYIETIKLTPKGRGVARKLLGQQQSLPLKMKREKRMTY